MYANQNQHEHQVQVIIDQHHRDAIQAEQIRVARTQHPSRIAMAATSIRASIGSLLIAIGETISGEPVSCPNLAGKLPDSALTA